MGKKAPSPPAAPDPAAVAQAQAEANRIAQFTPQGTLLFGRQRMEGDLPVFEPEGGKTAIKIQESPFQEQTRLAQESITGELANRAFGQLAFLPAGGLNFEGLPTVPQGLDFRGLPALPGDFGAQRAQTEQAVFDRARSLLEPELAQREQRLRDELAQNLIPTTARAASGPTGALTAFETGRGRAMNELALQAVEAGAAEQSRLFGLQSAARGQMVSEQLQGLQAGLQARQQSLGERTLGRQTAFNELAALLGGQQLQPLGLNQFIPPAAIDIIGANQLAQNAQLAAFNAANQRSQAATGGLFDLAGALGSAAIFASSRMLKHDDRPVGDILPRIKALPVRAWKYKGDEVQHLGPYAEDFHFLFGVGNDHSIYGTDGIGVCLLGIQELLERVEALENGRT